MKRTAVIVFIAAYLTNFIWEFLHYPLYVCPIPRIPCALGAAAIDAIIIEIFYLAGAVLFRNNRWIINMRKKQAALLTIASLLTACIIELRAFWLHKWSYTALMPIIPVLNVGISPLVQLPLTALFTFYLTKKISIYLLRAR